MPLNRFAQADQQVSILKDRIARQREAVKQAKLRGHAVALAEAAQQALEQTLRAYGDDLRREPIEVRKAMLASILRKSRPDVRLNEHMEHSEGAVVFQHACKMGLVGIGSKRLGSRHRSGCSPDWLKFKNPEAPAVKREAE